MAALISLFAMPTCLVVSTALRPNSKTVALARAMAERLAQAGAQVDLLDLAHTPLPPCDGASCYADPSVRAATARVAQADGVVICSPIYNYHFNSAAKAFVELTNEGWRGKIVGLIANAGGERSFMAALPFLNLLWLDHRCLVAPRFVYATSSAFGEDGAMLPTGDCAERLTVLAAEMNHLMTRLTSRNPVAEATAS